MIHIIPDIIKEEIEGKKLFKAFGLSLCITGMCIFLTYYKPQWYCTAKNIVIFCMILIL